MRNILIVSPTPFAPANAGNRERIKALIDTLTEAGHGVHFAHVCREHGDDRAMAERLGSHFYSIPYTHPRKKHSRILRARLRLDSAYRYDIDEWYDEGIEHAVLEIVRDHDIDTVFVEYVFLSRLFEALPANVTKVLDTHDVFGDRHKRFLRHGLKSAWFSCSVTDETKALERADTVIAIQEREAEYFRKTSSKPVVTVGHVTQVGEEYRRAPTPTDLLYVGSNNPINLASLNWFLQNVMPGVHQNTGTRLKVVGSIGNALATSPCIERVGHVDELASAYGLAAVAVNPSQFGTGLKIKTIEALAHGCPVVATCNGAEGFEQARNRGLFISDDPMTLENTIIKLLTDGRWNQEMSLAARTTIKDYDALCRDNLQSILDHDRC